jgi:hypothetical protein
MKAFFYQSTNPPVDLTTDTQAVEQANLKNLLKQDINQLAQTELKTLIKRDLEQLLSQESKKS